MKTWVYSDPHFYHQNICQFTNYDGSKVRPWDDAELMTQELIEWYNELVDDSDRVYLLGDVAFSKNKFRAALEQMKGRIVLVPGNHDPVKSTWLYSDLGLDVRGYVVKKGFVMSHMPIHPQSLSRWKLNIHGHLHNNQITLWQQPDERYYCACVERTNFRPIELQQILDERKDVLNAETT